jgi:hypothetical protein
MERTAGLGRVAARPGWIVRAETGCESVPSAGRPQRRRAATWRGAGRRCRAYAMVEPPGLEPRLHEAVQGRAWLQRAEEGWWGDPLERLNTFIPLSTTHW